MISFALEDFNQCKQGDVLFLQQRLFDLSAQEWFRHDRYIIFDETKTVYSFAGIALHGPSKRPCRFTYSKNKDATFFHTTPDEWPDEIAAVRMKLI
jgi:hypothetical protein